MTDLLEIARAIVRPWIEPLGLDDIQKAMLADEILAALAAERDRCARIAEAHPDDDCQSDDPELVRGCCEVIEARIRRL